MNLSQQEKELLLRTARESIRAHLEHSHFSPSEQTGNLSIPCGAFVTLRKSAALRGCIGNIVATRPLIDTVCRMAVESSFHDPRFPPLNDFELDQIEIEISVLSPLVRISSPEEIQTGLHGVYLRRGIRSGLLLPQVATEQGWNRDNFLTHTCYKAGLQRDSWKEAETELFTFTAVVFSEKNSDTRL